MTRFTRVRREPVKQLVIGLPDAWIDELVRMAVAESRTMSGQIRYMLKPHFAHLGEPEPGHDEQA
jgi:hypothetical protein